MSSRIDKFRDVHQGASIAVLGSSPTIGFYKGAEDVSIAVNGSVMCEPVHHADYFMCGDKMSPRRQWFDHSRDIADKRLVATFIAPFDPDVLGDEAERRVYQQRLEQNVHHQTMAGGDIGFSPPFTSLREPHGVFDYADIWEEEIRPDQERLCRGGTISGVAAQMAMVMGASEVHLYGCSFGKPSDATHYGYDNRGEPGGIVTSHPITMDYILSRLVENGVKVYSHGFTTLRIPQQVEEGLPETVRAAAG